MIFWEKWITQFFFWRLYQKFLNQGWCLVSKSPLYMNIAFPDNSVQYFMSSFHTRSRVLFKGKAPPTHVVSFFSFSVYDTSGALKSTLIDQNIPFLYTIVLGRDIAIPEGPASYCVIMRLYMRNPQEPLRRDFLPNIFLQEVSNSIRQLPVTPVRTIVENTISVQQDVFSVMSKRRISHIQQSSFFLPNTSKIANFFINEKAIYLVSFPPQHKNIVAFITGYLPQNREGQTDIRFVGFMACHLRTTSTDDSIGWMQLSNPYHIWVAYSEEDASAFGYHKKDPLLLWDSDNTHPILVYREVRTDRKGLFPFAKPNKALDPDECQRVMGPYYPQVTYFYQQ